MSVEPGYISTTESSVNVNASELLTFHTDPLQVFKLDIPWDLNYVWGGLHVPNRPITRTNPDGSLGQASSSTLTGDAADSTPQDFLNRLNSRAKATWSESKTNFYQNYVATSPFTITSTQLTFNQAMMRVVLSMLDPTVISIIASDSTSSLLDPDRNVVTSDGKTCNIDPEKIQKWLQNYNPGGLKPAPQTGYFPGNCADVNFATEVFTEVQIHEILEQIRNGQAYVPETVSPDHSGGQVCLAVNSYIAVRVLLEGDNSVGNSFLLELRIVHTHGVGVPTG